MNIKFWDVINVCCYWCLILLFVLTCFLNNGWSHQSNAVFLTPLRFLNWRLSLFSYTFFCRIPRSAEAWPDAIKIKSGYVQLRITEGTIKLFRNSRTTRFVENSILRNVDLLSRHLDEGPIFIIQELAHIKWLITETKSKERKSSRFPEIPLPWIT